MLMKKTIIIFSNPFGYGPTGKAIAIAKEFIDSGYSNVILACSSFTKEIIPESIPYISINERDEQVIRNYLRTIPNPVLISSQNRFAIKAALSLGIPCAFLDGLSWFWKEIPSDHLIADEIFWMKYPGLEEKLAKSPRIINVVPAIIDVQIFETVRDQILIHLGGCKNPLVEIFPRNYLDILADTLSTISSPYKIIVTGGAEAMDYLKTKLAQKLNDKVVISSLGHDQFIRELNCSRHFITTAGQTATLEAFSLNVPTSFLLPMNLSQLALTDLLSRYDANPQSFAWDKYVSEKINRELNERDAITEFNRYAEIIKTNSKIYIKLKNDLSELILHIPENKEQKKFINNLGLNGAKAIKNILTAKWNLI